MDGDSMIDRAYLREVIGEAYIAGAHQWSGLTDKRLLESAREYVDREIDPACERLGIL